MRRRERTQRRWRRSVELCERCGRVCDAACHARATRDRHLAWALRQGVGR